MSDPRQYWATLPGDKFIPAAYERIRRFYAFCQESGLYDLLCRSAAMAIGANAKNGAVTWEIRESGEQGELLLSAENHFHAIGEHKLNITTQQRPVIQCGAANSDKRSLEQTMLADGLVEYHLAEKALESLLKRATRRAIYCAEGFIEGEWDAQSGDDAAPDMASMQARMEAELRGEPPPPVRALKSGEPRFRCLGLLDVPREPTAESWDALTWRFTRRYESKFELAARYPEMAEKLLMLTANPSTADQDKRIHLGRTLTTDDSDLVPVWTFYHDRTIAVPEGRHVIFAGEDALLFDGPLPYRTTPLRRVSPEEVDGAPFGWTPMFDLLGPQEGVNALDSTIISNQLGRGVGNLITDDGSDVSVEALSSSMNLIKIKSGARLEPLEWPDTPKEFFAYKDAKVNAMATIVGTNPVAMGTPNEALGNDSSGAKLALIEATAMRNNSGLERSHLDLYRDVAQMLIHMYADFGGSVERKAKIAGKARDYIVKSFSGEELGDIDRVKVDIGNPLLRTTGGKLAVAEKAVELGVIRPGELDKFIHLLKEGTAEPLYEAKQAEMLRIRGENEALLEGKRLHRALLSDPHWKEISEHLSLLDNPNLRESSSENDAIQAAILGAVQEHIELFLQMPPWMVMMRGGPEALAIYQQVQMVAAPPIPGDPSQTPAPPPGEQGGTQPPPSGDATEALTPPGGGGQPSMPSMPQNPLTGQKADLSTPEVLQ